MANTIISGNVTEILPQEIESNEYFLLLDGASFTATSATGIFSNGTASNVNFILNGDFFHVNQGTAISTSSGVSDANVRIGATGSLTTVGELNPGVQLRGDSSTFVNDGVVATRSIFLDGTGSFLINNGTISSAGFGTFTVGASGLGGRIVNTGDIVGSFGAFMGSGGTFVNSGTLTTSNIGIDSVSLSIGMRVSNSGLIDSGEAIAISGRLGADTIQNTGQIIGQIELNGDEDTVRNSGEISGDVDLGAGNDLYVGRGIGLVSGLVRGGEGDDTLRGSAEDDNLLGDSGNDSLFGGAGNDTLVGGIEDDTLFGGSDDDVLSGGGNNDSLVGQSGDDNLTGGTGNDNLVGGTGDDTLRGGNDNDTLRGGSGNDSLEGDDGVDFLFAGNDNDELSGGADNDFLRGEAGEDVLDGGAGVDDLRGGSGDDRLIGGLNGDRLYGGLGSDAFVFENVTDSGSGNIDNIFDFKQGEDVLDFDSFVGQFDFVGTGTHSGGGDASIRYLVTSLGVSVRADVDGNGSSDLILTVRGLDAMTADDFIL